MWTKNLFLPLVLVVSPFYHSSHAVEYAEQSVAQSFAKTLMKVALEGEERKTIGQVMERTLADELSSKREAGAESWARTIRNKIHRSVVLFAFLTDPTRNDKHIQNLVQKSRDTKNLTDILRPLEQSLSQNSSFKDKQKRLLALCLLTPSLHNLMEEFCETNKQLSDAEKKVLQVKDPGLGYIFRSYQAKELEEQNKTHSNKDELKTRTKDALRGHFKEAWKGRNKDDSNAEESTDQNREYQDSDDRNKNSEEKNKSHEDHNKNNTQQNKNTDMFFRALKNLKKDRREEWSEKFEDFISLIDGIDKKDREAAAKHYSDLL